MLRTARPRTWIPLKAASPVFVWVAPVSECPGPCALASLSDEERNRAGRFRNPVDAVRYLASHAFLREVLGERLGIEPGLVCLEKESGGKPRLSGKEGGRLFFNLSHSGGHAAVALSEDAEVGVDIERVEHGLDWEQTAGTWLAEKEVGALRALPGEDSRLEGFFRLWCAREAVAKALGKGLSLDSRTGGSLEGILACGSVTARFKKQWVEVASMEAPQGYRLAAAVLVPGKSRENGKEFRLFPGS